MNNNKQRIKGTTLTIDQIRKLIKCYMSGLYTYNDLEKTCNISIEKIKKVFTNEEIIEKCFDKKTYLDLKNRIQKVSTLRDYSIDGELVRNHEARNLIKEDIFYLKSYDKKTLELATLFLKYSGSLDKLVEITEININEIVNLLHNSNLKDIMLPNVYVNYISLLEIETALFKRDLQLIHSTIERIAYMYSVLKYQKNTISFILNLPEDSIGRILNDSYTIIKMKKNSTLKISNKEIKENITLDIADVFINNNLSLIKIGDIFNLSKVMIFNYLKNDLKDISLEKYNKVCIKLNERNTHIATDKKLNEIKTMKELYDKGYTIDEIANIIHRHPTTVYRNLTSYFPNVSEIMHVKKLNNLIR